MTITTREEQKISNKEVGETLHDVIESVIDGHEGFSEDRRAFEERSFEKVLLRGIPEAFTIPR